MKVMICVILIIIIIIIIIIISIIIAIISVFIIKSMMKTIHQMQEKSFYYLLIMCTKNIPESQVRRHCESVRALFVICTRVTTLHSCYNFALVLHENALVVS